MLRYKMYVPLMLDPILSSISFRSAQEKWNKIYLDINPNLKAVMMSKKKFLRIWDAVEYGI